MSVNFEVITYSTNFIKALKQITFGLIIIFSSLEVGVATVQTTHNGIHAEMIQPSYKTTQSQSVENLEHIRHIVFSVNDEHV